MESCSVLKNQSAARMTVVCSFRNILYVVSYFVLEVEVGVEVKVKVGVVGRLLWLVVEAGKLNLRRDEQQSPGEFIYYSKE